MPRRLILMVGGTVLAGALWAQTFPENPPLSAPPGPAAQPTPGGTPAAGLPPAVPPPPAAPAEDDPTRTAGGALRLFMASRDYRSIRELKSVLTPRLRTRYDTDSVPFNGKRGIRLAAFYFGMDDLKPVPPPGGTVRGRAAAGQVKGAPVAAVGGPASGAAQASGGAASGVTTFNATVRSLWEEQGEAVELRVETVRLALQEEGLWRIGDLAKVESQGLRFTDPTPGVTALRMILRAWRRSDLTAARTQMSSAFLKRYESREEALREIFVGAPEAHRAAYQIVDLTPRGTDTEIARVRLYITMLGQPTPIDGPVRTLRLVKKGPRWLVDTWD
ncbi:MAG TPA: hypothetical protein VFT43_12880 [Candidatus Polarisedimenticolia bacterium]|nr:hypothetical protein [Candidatus Polarisedimenticolia bacterium]